MKCPKCNFDVSENSKFCPECGTSMSSFVPEVENISQKNNVPKKSKKPIILVAIISGIVVLLSLLSYFVAYPLIKQANGDYSVIIEMYKITEYKVPEGTTEIKVGAFGYSDLPTSIILPDSITEIKDDTFSYMKNLKYVSLGDNVTSIGARAFYECESLETIYLKSSLKNIGDSAFYKCESLEYIDLNEGLITIGRSAFAESGLTGIVFPKSLTYVGESAFSACEDLGFASMKNSNVKTISSMMFSGCSDLCAVSLPDCTTVIELGAFTSCKIIDLEIPEGVTTIKSAAFSWNERMLSVIFPKSLKTIEQTAFYKCELEEIYYAGSSSDWSKIDIDYNLNSILESPIVYRAYNYKKP